MTATRRTRDGIEASGARPALTDNLPGGRASQLDHRQFEIGVAGNLEGAALGPAMIHGGHELFRASDQVLFGSRSRGQAGPAACGDGIRPGRLRFRSGPIRKWRRRAGLGSGVSISLKKRRRRTSLGLWLSVPLGQRRRRAGLGSGVGQRSIGRVCRGRAGHRGHGRKVHHVIVAGAGGREIWPAFGGDRPGGVDLRAGPDRDSGRA